MGRSPGTGFVLCLPLVLFLAAVFVVPLLGLLPESLAGGVSPWANYARAVDGRGGLWALRNSLVLSALVASASLVLCLPPAWMLARGAAV